MDTLKKIENIKSIVQTNCFRDSTYLSNLTRGCKRVFDGFYCWPETEAGVLAIQPCSNRYIKTYEKNALATKQCTKNGTWFVNEETKRPWTNLTQCQGIYMMDESQNNGTIDPIYDTWVPIIKGTAYFGYCISVLSLIIGLVTFISIKRLHCERNRLHINLFLSFILRALMFILKDILFVRGTALSTDATYDIDGEPFFNYTWLCKIFISVRNYSILLNFTFMLMEGLYLHNLIFLNLFSEHHGTVAYCIVGWVMPIVFIIPWIVLRSIYANTLCWTQKDDTYILLFIDVPIGITVVVNFVLFIIIVRVLILKLHFTSTFIQQKKKYRKLLKSTLILIPLFGIPYLISLLLSFYIHTSAIFEVLWLFFDQTFTAFQGLFASLVYCLLNSEVQTEIKRKYSFLKDQNNKEFRRSRTISCNTQQFSLQNNDDALENLNLFGIVDDETVKNNFKQNL